MVYVDENRQRYEAQYCVVLREGKNAGIRQYFQTSKDIIEKFFKNFGFGDNAPTIVEMGYIIGQGKREITDKICFHKKRLGSLVFECQNEETVNKCFKYWKLPFTYSDGKPLVS